MWTKYFTFRDIWFISLLLIASNKQTRQGTSLSHSFLDVQVDHLATRPHNSCATQGWGQHTCSTCKEGKATSLLPSSRLKQSIGGERAMKKRGSNGGGRTMALDDGVDDAGRMVEMEVLCSKLMSLVPQDYQLDNSEVRHTNLLQEFPTLSHSILILRIRFLLLLIPGIRFQLIFPSLYVSWLIANCHSTCYWVVLMIHLSGSRYTKAEFRLVHTLEAWWLLLYS